MPPTLTLIAALDQTGAIGRASGGLPWHLPDESAHFRAYCRNQWLLVGRRTFEEMTGWFQPGHHVLVLSRQSPPPAATIPGTPSAGTTAATPAHIPVTSVATVADAMETARHGGAHELVTLGGALVFAAALPWATRLVLSRIDLQSGGEVHFPEIDPSQWHRVEVSRPHVDAATGVSFTVEYWQRYGPSPTISACGLER